MPTGKGVTEATLVDVLIDGFERNEVLGGFHARVLPLQSADAARLKFVALSEEAKGWKGEPTHSVDANGRRLVGWADLEIRQVGRGVMVRVRAPRFEWWNDRATWEGDPIGPLYDWLEEERGLERHGHP